MKTGTVVKYVIFGIISVVAFIVVAFLGFTVMYPGSYVVPDKSEYAHGVTIYSNPEDTMYGPFMPGRPKDSYTAVNWEAFSEPGDTQCPLTITIDDKTWKPADLEFESFLKSGAVDERVEHAKVVGSPVDLSSQPVATFATPDSKAKIYCVYNQANLLIKVQASVRHSVVRGKSTGQQKTMKVNLPEGTVTLPADHSTLVKQLGKPLKHTRASIAYSSNIH